MSGEFVIAVHAAVFLKHKGGWISSEEIASNVCTNPVCVRRVMSKLVKSGIVAKREGGKNGGYSLKCEDAALTDIADALHTAFVETKYRSGDIDKHCVVSSGMAAFFEGLCGELDALCRSRLTKLTLNDVERALCGRKSR